MQQFLQRIAVLIMISFPSWVQATEAQQVLQQRLGKIDSFQAHFTQKVLSSDGTVVQQAQGELWVKRPNLFRWHTISPDESVLVSDGKTVWFYNPFVEEVTANWLDKIAQHTPFMLIARNQPADWAQYRIQQAGDSFILIPKHRKENLQRFTLTVNPQGKISSFSVVEKDGQKTRYDLTKQIEGTIDAKVFHFTLPKGVTLDDQRQQH